MKIKNKKGFTLIELLIVIAIIAILSAVIFVALNPLKRFQDTRDSRRWQDVSNILNAIKIDQVDNGGTYISALDSLVDGSVYMLGTDTSNCDSQNTNCDTGATGTNYCVNLYGLTTEGYLGSIPISPNGDGSWSSNLTGYTIQKDSSGVVTVRACESENSSEISVVR